MSRRSSNEGVVGSAFPSCVICLLPSSPNHNHAHWHQRKNSVHQQPCAGPSEFPPLSVQRPSMEEFSDSVGKTNQAPFDTVDVKDEVRMFRVGILFEKSS